MNTEKQYGGKLRSAIEFLKNTLTAKPMKASYVLQIGKNGGHKSWNIKSAAKKISCSMTGRGSRAMWGLPKSDSSNAQTKKPMPNRLSLYKKLHGMSCGKKISSARDFLKEQLSRGPIESRDIKKLAQQHGHALMTLKDASKDIGVEKKFTGSGYSTWSLPNSESVSPKILRAAKRATPPQSSCAAKDILEFFMSKQNQKCFTFAEAHRINKKINELTFED
jgi:hypothetical protein